MQIRRVSVRIIIATNENSMSQNKNILFHRFNFQSVNFMAKDNANKQVALCLYPILEVNISITT